MRARTSVPHSRNSVVIVQARTGSTRLPSKVMAPIGDYPMVLHVLERAALIGSPVILATTDLAEDDDLDALVREAGYETFRGSSDDVLDRYWRAAPDDAELIVRITADCPLLDPAVARAVLATLEQTDADLVSNVLPPSFPDGLDCSAVRRGALRVAWMEATFRSDREHVLPFICRQHDRFQLLNVACIPDWSAERWTVDDERDLAFIREVHAEVGQLPLVERSRMSTVLDLLRRRPDIRSLNAGTPRNAGYARSLREERLSPSDTTSER